MKSLKTTFINIRRTPYKSLATIIMLSLTFFVVYGFSLFLFGSQQVLQYFESRPKIIAFFDIRAETEEIDEVKTALEQSGYIDSLTIVSKQEAFSYYQEEQENPLLLELVTADILPASIEISATSPENLSLIDQELKQFDQIDEIVIQYEIIEQLSQWVNSIRMIGIVITGVLLTLSLVIIINTISFKVSGQKKKVSILRFIGADTGYIITPFIYEGFIYGILGSVVGWGLIYAALLYLTPWLTTLVGQIITFPIPWEALLIQLGFGTSLALFFSGFASIVAAKSLIKR
jgi:cell division transport system permease protein